MRGFRQVFYTTVFYNIKLPDWLAFFGGKRFVPIVTSGCMVVLAFIFGYVWPTIQTGINDLAQWIIGAGALGVGVYCLLNRLLIPLGLHHVLNSLVWFEFGTYKGVHGDLTRFFKGDPTAGTFMVGFFPIMMFGLLNGEGFDIYVKAGDSVKKGQKLLQVNLDDLKKKVPSVITLVVFTNLEADQAVKINKPGNVRQAEEAIIEID